MNQDSILRDVLKRIGELGVDYMLTGSYASNIYGRVRSTFDADIVIALSAAPLERLIASLGEDFYIDATTLQEIGEAGGQFNAIHRPSGFKVDFYLPRNAHDRQALRRGRKYSLWDIDVSVIAPEDLVLAKLAWAKEGGSARQLEDAKGVYEVQEGSLDIEYLESQAADLDLADLLKQISK